MRRRSTAMDKAIRWMHRERREGRSPTAYQAAKKFRVSLSATYTAWGQELEAIKLKTPAAPDVD